MTKTLRQHCAQYIIDYPGSTMNEIRDGIAAYTVEPKAKMMCRTLNSMTKLNQVVRSGTLKRYTYTPGENIDDALADIAPIAPTKYTAPSRSRCDGGVMQIRQLWVRQGDYTIEPGEMMHRNLWDYADSFR